MIDDITLFPFKYGSKPLNYINENANRNLTADDFDKWIKEMKKKHHFKIIDSFKTDF